MNIKKDTNSTSTSCPKKISRVICTRDKSLLSSDATNFCKPGSGSLFKTIESTMKMIDFVRRMFIARWRMHINFLSKITIQEGIFDIHLKQLPMTHNSYGKQRSNRGN